jgi:undecaprenyl diphosphate synthase
LANIDQLPKATHRALLEGIERTKHNDRMTLVLALNYSGRWDLVRSRPQTG